MPRQPILFSWSGGKDSALALAELLNGDEWEVVALLTSVSDEYRRISHHGIREDLLEDQAAALDLPLDKLRLPTSAGPCTNAQYEAIVGNKLQQYASRGVFHVAHGDLFLGDLRAYRERNLARIGMRGIFPLWGRNTSDVMTSFIALGYRAVLCCVEDAKVDSSFVGREIDEKLLCDLPRNVDPCGEHGEYHSFVYDGPIFRRPVSFSAGEVVCRDNRHYVDLIPRARAKVASVNVSIPPVL